AGANPEQLRTTMSSLNLHAASRTMSGGVGFVLAIPILQPEESHRFVKPSPVAGVIYVDSEAPGFFISDEELHSLVAMTQEFVDALLRASAEDFERIHNPFAALSDVVPPAETLSRDARRVLELVSRVEPPKTSRPFQFNFDYSDFLPIEAVGAPT